MHVGRLLALANKSLRLLRHRSFVQAALRYRTAAAVEHLRAISLAAPATLLDVGANKGQFSLAVKTLFPQTRVIAFEPFAESADRYETLFTKFDDVTLHRIALSDTRGELDFFVTDRVDSSSLLKPGAHQTTAFGVSSQRTIKVSVERIDKIVDLDSIPHPILMKVDVQGAELQVLQGFDSLEYVDYIYVELSFVELYEGQMLFDDIQQYVISRGFVLIGVFNQVITRAFGPTQADFLFRNRAITSPADTSKRL